MADRILRFDCNFSRRLTASAYVLPAERRVDEVEKLHCGSVVMNRRLAMIAWRRAEGRR